MHHAERLEKWHSLLVQRNAKLGGYVHRISDKEFTAEDKKEFNIDWTPVPCKALEVRITQPYLPHGAKGLAVRARRTMLPWFIGLQQDLETLEIVEGGSWLELAIAHTRLDTGPCTLSGLPNKYGALLFPFPGAVSITGLSPLSDALVCRRKHDDIVVMLDKKKLLLGFDKERSSYIAVWRERARGVAL
jgi:hypothetical protein